MITTEISVLIMLRRISFGLVKSTIGIKGLSGIRTRVVTKHAIEDDRAKLVTYQTVGCSLYWQ